MRGAERHQRAKAVFLELMALPAHLRAEALRQATADDPGLYDEVESLLRHAGSTETDDTPLKVSEATTRRFLPGEMFATRYRIIAELGGGATGEVYRALDTRLDVEIALKIIRGSSPAAIRRLIDETRLARQITHPAVCRVYDVGESDGEHFLTMELVDGENLAALLARVGRLSASKVGELAAELLSGLAAAHACGILHRDLKPSNVMVDGEGRVRITDFGIATYEARAETEGFAGTPAFMAPEQLERGAPASVQTDLYGAGLILYEALCGHEAAAAQVAARRARAGAHFARPSSLGADVDAGLDQMLMRLLAADPSERPRSAAEAADALEVPAHGGVTRRPYSRRRVMTMLAALSAALAFAFLGVRRWVWFGERPVCEQIAEVTGAPSDQSNVRIAVLPLTDASDRRDQASLAKAIQRQIIDRLEGIRALSVIAEESSGRFDASDVANAGRELGADFVSVGRIEGSADDPRVDIALFDVHDGKPVWRDTYVSDANASVPDADRRFVAHVAETLRIDPENATQPSSAAADPDPETYRLFLRGREHVPPYSEREFTSSVALLNQVLERKPRWAEAEAALATAYVVAATLGWIEAAEGYPLARRHGDRALALDPALCDAHVARAIVAGEYDWDWSAAEKSYRDALDVCPGSAWVHRSRARFLSTQGRFKEALEAAAKALELDPTSAVMVQGAAHRFYEARQYTRAVALARIAVRLDPLYPYTYSTLGFALIEQGDCGLAVDAFDKLDMIAGHEEAATQVRRAYASWRAGDRRSAALAAEVRGAGTLTFADRALLALAEHDDDAAVAALAAAVEARAPPSIWLAVDPTFQPLRNREDFRSLVASVGLPHPSE